MPDWTKSMEQTYEFYIIDPNTWKDKIRIDTITSCTITRDFTTETLSSASFDCDEDLTKKYGECYVRVYLVTIQNRVRERHCLGTFIVQTPSVKFDGMHKSVGMDAYSPLLELKDNKPPIGYSAMKHINTMRLASELVYENCRAPVTRVQNDANTLKSDFVANPDDSWLSYISDLMANAKYRFGLTDKSEIIFDKITDIKALPPIYTFNDDNSSLLLPSIDDKRDLYGIPNALEMTYTTQGTDGTNEFMSVRVENNDENSEISTVRRGRVVLERVTDPTLTGSYTKEQFKRYAMLYLENLSTLEHTVSFSHGYVPVTIGDCVRLNYRRSGIVDQRARIVRQTINCVTGCTVDTDAAYTTELWRAIEHG